MATSVVKIIRKDGFTVQWKNENGKVEGMVSVRSMKQARLLKLRIEEGMAPAAAIIATLVPAEPKRLPGWEKKNKFAAKGGAARSKNLTAAERSAISAKGAAARWGKKVAS